MAEFPDMKGLSYRNLQYIRQLYLFYNQWNIIVQQVVAQLQEGFGQQPVAQISEEVFFSVPWGHHLYIISQCKDVDRAVFYLQKTVENGWSRYVVVELKIVDFMPEFIDKLNFYVSAADELLRGEGDNPSIGILLWLASLIRWANCNLNYFRALPLHETYPLCFNSSPFADKYRSIVDASTP